MLVEEMLQQLLNDTGFKAPLQNLGGGYFQLGRRRIYAQIVDGRVSVKTP